MQGGSNALLAHLGEGVDVKKALPRNIGFQCRLRERRRRILCSSGCKRLRRGDALLERACALSDGLSSDRKLPHARFD